MPPGDHELPETVSAIGPDSSAGADFEFDSQAGDAAGDSSGTVEGVAELLIGDDTPTGAKHRECSSEPIPEFVGRYRVRSVLGAGGFGTVYLASDTELDRLVAVKVPRSDQLGSERLREMFLREAKTAAKLRHPSLVTVHDLGHLPDGRCFVVMEYVEGEPLSAIMERGPVDFAEAMRLSVEAARALDVLHRQNVLHRDIKPANILVSTSGEVRLTDFGLSVSAPARHGVKDRYAGTLHYMAPEQIRGESHRLDSRTDVWGLGVVMYELFTGVRPFAVGETAAVIEAIQRADAADPSKLNASLPPAIDRVVRKCLAKRMQQRYLTAGELARELEAVRIAAAPAGFAAPPVPRGLRPYGPADADWYLSLLPGLRDRDGLPESIAYWKSRVEAGPDQEPFAVGVLLGPSGVGKSSFLRAGLLPSLADWVNTVSVRAAAGFAAPQLRAALVDRMPELAAAATLRECIAALRQRSPIYAAEKILVVVDQFEQCLRPGPARQELVEAFRQFDGVCVQLLLAARDDYWLQLKRFMDDLDVELDPSHNFAALDLFEPNHSRAVLCSLGAGHGRCGGRYEDCSPEERRFVDSAIAELERDGRVSPVQIALFAEMHRDLPWVLPPGSRLRFKDVGVAFLQRSFAAGTQGERHERAAQAVLSSLLPDDATRIVDSVRTRQELLEASGYAGRPEAFDSLMEMLEDNLRLILRVQDDTGSGGVDRAEGRYQLSHDILVQAVRDWVRLRQEASPEGRAYGTLARRNDAWRHLKDKRFLPSLLEWVVIAVRTDRDRWTPSQAALMRAAARRHASRLFAAAAAMLLAAWIGWGLWTLSERDRAEMQLTWLAYEIEHADTPSSLQLSGEVDRSTLQQLKPALRERLKNAAPESSEAMRLRLALLPADPSLLGQSLQDLLRVRVEDFAAVRDAVEPYAEDLIPRLWEVAGSDAEEESAIERQLRALAALAAYEPASGERWQRTAPAAAEKMVRFAADNPAHLPTLTDWFRPVERQLFGPLSSIFRDDPVAERRLMATAFLSDFTRGDLTRRAELVLDADRRQFEILIDRFAAGGNLSAFRDELDKRVKPAWPAATEAPTLPAHLARRVEQARGFSSSPFVFCLAAMLHEAESLDRELVDLGYRMTRFRPYTAGEATVAAAVWIHDGQPGATRFGMDADECRELVGELSDRGCKIEDVAGYPLQDGSGPATPRYAIAWQESTAASPQAVLIGRTSDDFKAEVIRLSQAGYVPRSYQAFDDVGDKTLHSAVWETPTDFDEYEPPPGDQSPAAVGADRRAAARLAEWSPSGGQDTLAVDSWFPRIDGEARLLMHVDAAAHLKACREWAASGYRPWTVAVDPAGRVASLWRRPRVPEAVKDRLASRRANAALALMRLAPEDDAAWSLFEWRHDPRARSFLIDRAELGAPPQTLLARLCTETDEGAIRGMAMAFGAVAKSKDVDLAIRTPARAALVRLAQEHPDPGVHAAASWAARQLGQPLEPPRSSPPEGARWYVDPLCGTMVVFEGPIVFQMGAPHGEAGRFENEPLRQATIDRSYAIGATELTTENYEQFIEDRPEEGEIRYEGYYAAEGHPQTAVTWHQAAAYCNWLSEKAGLPREQWCYERTGFGEDGVEMREVADSLLRTGYRLPTDAEWEYASRAGAATRRHYGDADSLLSRYGYRDPESGISVEVATLMPNDFGLFDTLGNAREWVQDAVGGERVIRGGSFYFQTYRMRSASRSHLSPGVTLFEIGFRVARTLPRPDTI